MTVRAKGPLPRDWRPKTEKGLAVLADAVDRYEQHHAEGTLPRSGRGTFYDLKPSGFGRGVKYVKRPDDPSGWWDPDAVNRYPTRSMAARKGRWAPDEVGPQYVQDMVGNARRAGLIPEDWVADARAPEPSWAFDGDETAEEVAERAVDYLRRQRVLIGKQVGQDRYIEAWCEAGDLIARLSRIARREFGIPTFSGGGMDGLKGKRAAAERIAERAADGIGTVILLVGDLDLYGARIRSVYEADVMAWATKHYGVDPDLVTFERIALTVDQARAHDLLDADGKAEADGLPVPVMDQILRDAVGRHSDPAPPGRGRSSQGGGERAPAGADPRCADRHALRRGGGVKLPADRPTM